MKKIFSYLLLLSMIFSLTACTTEIEYKDDLENYKTKESLEDVGENKKFEEEITKNPNATEVKVSDTLKINYLNEKDAEELLTKGTGVLLLGNLETSSNMDTLNTYMKAINGGNLPINYLKTNGELSEDLQKLVTFTNTTAPTVVFVKDGNVVSTVDLSTISESTDQIYQKAKEDIYKIN